MTENDVVALLAETARSGGCPACRVIARLLYAEMCRLQYDAVHDAVVGREVASAGLCADHLWYLLDLASPSTVAEIVVPLLRNAQEGARALGTRIGEDSELLRRGSGAVVRTLVARECVTCRSVRAWEDAIVRALVHDGEPAREFPEGRLCVPHLGRVVEALPPGLASRLLARWADAAGTLAERLAALAAARGADHRSASPDLLRAPGEAISRLAGGRGSGRAPR